MRDRGARNALQIPAQADQGQIRGPLDQVLDLDFLSETELEDEVTARAQSSRCRGDQPGDEGQAVSTAEQRDRWLMIADLRLQRRAGSVDHVRRVGHNRVEGAVDAVEQVAVRENDTAINAMSSRCLLYTSPSPRDS